MLAYDGVHLPDVMAMCAASASLALSGVPCPKPVAAVRVALLEEEKVEAEELDELLVVEEEAMDDGDEVVRFNFPSFLLSRIRREGFQVACCIRCEIFHLDVSCALMG